MIPVYFPCNMSALPGKKDKIGFVVTRINDNYEVAEGIITRLIKRASWKCFYVFQRILLTQKKGFLRIQVVIPIDIGCRPKYPGSFAIWTVQGFPHLFFLLFCNMSALPGKKDKIGFVVTRINDNYEVAEGIITRLIKRASWKCFYDFQRILLTQKKGFL